MLRVPEYWQGNLPSGRCSSIYWCWWVQQINHPPSFCSGASSLISFALAKHRQSQITLKLSLPHERHLRECQIPLAYLVRLAGLYANHELYTLRGQYETLPQLAGKDQFV